MAYNYPFQSVNEQTKVAVWQKGTPIHENEGLYDPTIWRRDICGKVMRYTDHGDTTSKYGWEIDHIKPTAKGGETTLDNLQPLYWENNRKKGDSYPWPNY